MLHKTVVARSLSGGTVSQLSENDFRRRYKNKKDVFRHLLALWYLWELTDSTGVAEAGIPCKRSVLIYFYPRNRTLNLIP